jgi:hypothetical protein
MVKFNSLSFDAERVYHLSAQVCPKIMIRPRILGLGSVMLSHPTVGFIQLVLFLAVVSLSQPVAETSG